MGEISNIIFNEIMLSYGILPRVFIETGTYLGQSTSIAKKRFKKVQTIELSEVLYNKAKTMFNDSQNVVCHFGDSKKILPEIVHSIQESIFFYLDAHWSGGVTAFGEEEVPLLEELKAIKKHPFADIVLIDDLRLFGMTGECVISPDHPLYPLIKYDWREITKKACREAIGKDNIELEYELGDLLVFFKKGKTKTRASMDRIYTFFLGIKKRLKETAKQIIPKPILEYIKDIITKKS